MSATLTIENYLRGKVGYTISDEAIASILSDRNIEPGTDVFSLDADPLTNKKIKELCTADLYIYCSNTPTTIQSSKDSDGNWSIESGGMQHSAYDSRKLRELAKIIYDRYGESVSTQSVIRIIDL